MTFLALWLAVLSWPGLHVMGQTGQTVVRPDPLVFEVGIGQVKTLDILLENAVNVYGIDVRGQFDPQAVEMVDSDPAKDGVQMLPGSFPSPDFVVINATENITGTFQFVTTQVNPTPPANGNGIVLSLQIRGKSIGESAFVINYVETADRYGVSLPVTPQNGTIRVVQSGILPTETRTATVAPSATSTASPTFTHPAPNATRQAQTLPITTSTAMQTGNNTTPVATFTRQVASSTTNVVALTPTLIDSLQTPFPAVTLTSGVVTAAPNQVATATTVLKKATVTATVLAQNAVTQTQITPTEAASGNFMNNASLFGVAVLLGLGGIVIVLAGVFIFIKPQRSK
jgi:hypothetical protein